MSIGTQAPVTEEEAAVRRARFPLGAALTWPDLEAPGSETLLDELRRVEPVSWVPAIGGWLVSTRSAARELLRSASTSVAMQENLVRASLGPMMLTSDAETHSRVRRPFERPFKATEIVGSFGPVIVEESDRLIDTFAARGSADFAAEFAAPFSVRMAGRMLGLSLDDTERITSWYAAFAEAMSYDGDAEPLHRAGAARAELDQILLAELSRTRREPDDSVTSTVARDPQGLSDEEIVAQFRVILFGAVETVQASLTSTMWFLLQHPDQLAQVRAGPELMGAAVEEAIRLVSPVGFVERWTTEPVTLAGVQLPAGEFVGVSVTAANRDPQTFEDPAVFDLHRRNAGRTLSFSFGIHACLGIHLARLETAEALRRLLERFPRLEVAAAEPPTGFVFRKPARLELVWS